MPSLRDLLPYIPALLVLFILMRIEIVLAHDVGARRLRLFSPERRFEYKLVSVFYLLHWLIDGGAGAITIMIVNSIGGGLIRLSDEGWRYIPSFLCFLVVVDFYTYVIHRLYHRIPALWSMHSLHHSATELSATTGGRHFWFETLVGAVFFSPILGILFAVPADVLFPVTLLNFFAGVLTHFNVPICLGKLTLWINNPQWHRIHHSAQAEHRDKNFANFFPVFDLIFGTAWIPEPHDFPDVGLVAGDKPLTVFEGMIWPLRHVWRRWRSQGTDRAGAGADSGALAGAENIAVLEATSR